MNHDRQRSEPYEIALPYGLTVTVKPLTTAGMAAAQAAARRAVEAIERQARERIDAGLELEGPPDLSADGERDGFYQAQLIRELAVRHVTSWSGVELGGRTGTADAREHCRGDGTCMGLLQAPNSGAASPFRSFSARAAQSR
jgi:hypothetical protein